MEAFKKNIEGRWVHVKGHDVNMEQYMRDCGFSEEEVKFFVPSEPKFILTTHNNGDIQAVSYPFQNNTDMVEHLTFKLSKGTKVLFEDPTTHKKTSIESYMEGGETFVQILRPVEQPGMKSSKMTFITNGNELEMLTEIYESDDETSAIPKEKTKMTRKFTKEAK